MMEHQQQGSIGHLGTVAALWSINRALTGSATENQQQSHDTHGPEDLSASLASHLSEGTMTSMYVPSFVRDCMSTIADWEIVKSEFKDEDLGTTVHLCTCFPSTDDTRTHESVRDLCRFVMGCVYRCLRDAPPLLLANIPRSITVTTIACPNTRTFPLTPGQPLEPTNVNAGVASTSEDSVFVYRSQHLEKVLIHELVHVFRLDAGLIHSEGVQSIEKRMMSSLRYTSESGRLCLYEAYTETLACYWHMFWWIMQLGRQRLIDISTPDAFVKFVNLTWNKELILYLEVCRGITRHYESAPEMNEKTHIFSYYFAKTAIWGCELDRMPLLIIDEDTAERFASRVEKVTTSAAFWREVTDREAAASSYPVMTGLTGFS